jgi:hypothetical protein
VLFCACSNDEEDMYIIKYVVRVDTDSAVQMLYPIPKNWWIHNYYESCDTIKERDASTSTYIECRCEDTVTTMRGEIYINGELKAEKESKKWLKVTCKFR